MVLCVALVYRLGAGFHGLGRRGLIAVTVGTLALLVTVGYAANALGSVTLSGGSGAGGPLAVLFIAVIAAELG